MNAFVKTTKGNFPNRNFYIAWKGLIEMRYNVIKFEEEDLNDASFWMSCNRSTPVFAGVRTFDAIIEKLGVIYNKIDTYPTILYPFMHRSVEKSTIKEFRSVWNKCSDEDSTPKLFMKPVDQKKFNGQVMRSILNWIPLAHLSEDTEVYLVSPIKFISEYRIYIHQQQILTGKHYLGDWSKSIDIGIVKEAIKTFEPIAPCAYALDFGLTEDGKTALVEFNDATSLGNYGLDEVRYADMLCNRWFEICK
jgi:hypothetical protein